MRGASLNIKEPGRELRIRRILSDVQCRGNYERDNDALRVYVYMRGGERKNEE